LGGCVILKLVLGECQRLAPQAWRFVSNPITSIGNFDQKTALEEADLVEANGLKEESGKEHGPKNDAG
jgi:hypothetical protein